jgi:hypothetical protein
MAGAPDLDFMIGPTMFMDPFGTSADNWWEWDWGVQPVTVPDDPPITYPASGGGANETGDFFSGLGNAVGGFIGGLFNEQTATALAQRLLRPSDGSADATKTIIVPTGGAAAPAGSGLSLSSPLVWGLLAVVGVLVVFKLLK